MPPNMEMTGERLTYRIIPWSTSQACCAILQEAKMRMGTRGYEKPIAEWPIDRNVNEWLTSLPTLQLKKWPLVVELGSDLDTKFNSVTREARRWVTRLADVGLPTPLAKHLHAFPLFRSRHLERELDGLVSNRDLIALHENCYAPRSEFGFNELLLTARWMCEDPEQRLYKTPPGPAYGQRR
jgi:hypothetical protein